MNNSQFFDKTFNANRDVWKQADGEQERVWHGGWEGWRADGGSDVGQASQQHSSAPYIIQIVNQCTSAISNVHIGDSYTNRTDDATQSFGNNANIQLTSTISGVTYQEFLAQSESQPFTVGKTMIISTSAGQLDQTAAITHRNASGDRNDHVITPTLDPYQQQTDRIIDEYEYLFDGMTRIMFNQINGSATVTVRLYIKNKFAASQIIAGRPELQNYDTPNIIKI